LIYLEYRGIIPGESRYERFKMISKSLAAASTRPVILSILTGGEIYGYQIIHSMIEISGGTLEWSEGTIYPVLHRLEKEGLIRSQWKISESGRRRKYYRLTDLGRKELEKERKQWMSVNAVLSKLWEPLTSYD
jgi:DNA-binding PadR family transcriptional regulator